MTALSAGQEIDWKEESQRFDAVAEAYDRFRPGYPIQLVDEIIDVSGLAPDARILEIGCGTGKATELFARRRYSILCLEPGRTLAAVAAHNLSGFNIEFEFSRFEDWEPGDKVFDLVVSAQAFHWVPKEVSYGKAAQVLKTNGWLAIFWNHYPGMSGPLFQELEQVYTTSAPSLSQPMGPIEETIERTRTEIVASESFVDVRVKTWPWTQRYSTQDYLGLLGTYSDHLRLDDAHRQLLFDGIADVIDRYGGYLDKPYLATLYLARKRNGLNSH